MQRALEAGLRNNHGFRRVREDVAGGPGSASQAIRDPSGPPPWAAPDDRPRDSRPIRPLRSGLDRPGTLQSTIPPPLTYATTQQYTPYGESPTSRPDPTR